MHKMGGWRNVDLIASACGFVVTVLLSAGFCHGQCYRNDIPNDLVFGQNYYSVVADPKKVVDDAENSLRGALNMYKGRRDHDIIFNITAPDDDVFEVIKLCMFTRNVRSANVRSTGLYHTRSGARKISSGSLYGNFPVARSNRWQKTCMKPYYPGKVHQVRIQLQMAQRRKKIRVQKLYMEACRCLN